MTPFWCILSEATGVVSLMGEVGWWFFFWVGGHWRKMVWKFKIGNLNLNLNSLFFQFEMESLNIMWSADHPLPVVVIQGPEIFHSFLFFLSSMDFSLMQMSNSSLSLSVPFLALVRLPFYFFLLNFFFLSIFFFFFSSFFSGILPKLPVVKSKGWRRKPVASRFSFLFLFFFFSSFYILRKYPNDISFMNPLPLCCRQ